jgi:choline monooxygenase
MLRSLTEIVHSYDADAPLERAQTIPAAWYLSSEVMDLERRTVFARSWQLAGRVDQVRAPGQYLSCVLASGEPVIVVRGRDFVLRGFFNVCRHHAAAVVADHEGSAQNLRCPYHGWTYSLEGELKGTPDFADVCDFDPATNGLVPIEVGLWEKWVFVRIATGEPPLETFLGADLSRGVKQLGIDGLHWLEQRHYTLDCNWKVFVDNYLDGGYHIPYLHKGLDSVLDYSHYMVELGERSCLQSSPIVTRGADAQTAAVRGGDRAYYYWIYPNFMINCYRDGMDTNLVVPHGIDKTDVIFDFYFSDVAERAREHNLASIRVSEQIQSEDVSICSSVQRGLRSGAYTAGRLSVRREAGEHLFHRLLSHDLRAGLAEQGV